MPKSKQTTSKPLVVDSIEIRLSDGQAFEIKSRDVERFCDAVARQNQAEKLGKRPPKSRFDREINLLTLALLNKENTPMVDIACAIIRSDKA